MAQDSKLVISGDNAGAKRAILELLALIQQAKAEASQINLQTPGGENAAMDLGRRYAGLANAAQQLARSTSPNNHNYAQPVNIQRAIAEGAQNARHSTSTMQAALNNLGFDATHAAQALANVSARKGGFPGAPSFGDWVSGAAQQVVRAAVPTGGGPTGTIMPGPGPGPFRDYYTRQYWEYAQQEDAAGRYPSGYRTWMGRQAPLNQDQLDNILDSALAGGDKTTRWTHPVDDKTRKFTPDDLDAWRQDALNRNKFGSFRGFWDYARNMADEMPTWMKSMGKGVGAAVGRYAIGEAEAATQRTLTGRRDIMGEAALGGELVGGLIGAAIGTPFGGFGSVLFAGIGGQIGGTVTRMFSAGQEEHLRTQLNLLGTGRVIAGMKHDYNMMPYTGFANDMMGPASTKGYLIPPSIYHAGKLANWVGRNAAWNSDATGLVREIQLMYGRDLEDFWPNAEEISGAYGSIAHGLVMGGIDPTLKGRYGAMGTGVPRPEMPANVQEVYNATQKGNLPSWLRNDLFPTNGSFQLPQALGRVATSAVLQALSFPGGKPQSEINKMIEDTGSKLKWSDKTIKYLKDAGGWMQDVHDWRKLQADGEEMEIGKWLTKNLALRSGRGVEEAGKALDPMLAALPQTGGNLADVLMRFGPVQASLYTEAWTPIGKSVEDVFGKGSAIGDLSHVWAVSQGAQREATMGGLQMRGKGHAIGAAYDKELRALETLPGGTQSLAYAKGFAKRKQALFQEYDEADTMAFGIPMAQLEGRRQRAALSPYMPGYSFGVALQGMRTRGNQLGLLRRRYGALKGAGLLSEGEELGMVQQMENLQTQNAADVAMISEGVENRIPAMTAGTPASYRRFDSYQLAAFNLLSIGHPGRGFGAVSGRQARMQDSFVMQHLGSPLAPAQGREFLMNNEAVLGTLKEIAHLLRQAVGGSVGYAKPRTGPRDLGPGGGNAPTGGDAPWG